MKVALVDNYDSFAWNLVHYLGALGAEVEVHRNDAITVEALAERQPDAIVISPGPCTPNEAGISLELIKKLGDKTPILGVCLGHQAIGAAYGGDVVRAPAPVHGKLSQIKHGGQGVLRGINGPFAATRYHSLVVKRDTLPAELSSPPRQTTASSWRSPIRRIRCTACSSTRRASRRSTATPS